MLLQRIGRFKQASRGKNDVAHGCHGRKFTLISHHEPQLVPSQSVHIDVRSLVEGVAVAGALYNSVQGKPGIPSKVNAVHGQNIGAKLSGGSPIQPGEDHPIAGVLSHQNRLSRRNRKKRWFLGIAVSGAILSPKLTKAAAAFGQISGHCTQSNEHPAVIYAVIAALSAAVVAGKEKSWLGTAIGQSKLLGGISRNSCGFFAPLQHALITAVIFFQRKKILKKGLTGWDTVNIAKVRLTRHRILAAGAADYLLARIKSKTVFPNEILVMQVVFINDISHGSQQGAVCSRARIDKGGGIPPAGGIGCSAVRITAIHHSYGDTAFPGFYQKKRKIGQCFGGVIGPDDQIIGVEKVNGRVAAHQLLVSQSCIDGPIGASAGGVAESGKRGSKIRAYTGFFEDRQITQFFAFSLHGMIKFSSTPDGFVPANGTKGTAAAAAAGLQQRLRQTIGGVQMIDLGISPGTGTPLRRKDLLVKRAAPL